MPVNRTSHRALVIGAAATALALTAGVGIGLAADGDSAPGTSKAAPLVVPAHTALYDAQPREETTDTSGSTAELLKIAGKVPGLRTHAFNKAVKEGTYLTWADKVGETFYDSDVTGTPAVKAGGRDITVLDDDGKPVGARQLTEEIEAAAAKR